MKLINIWIINCVRATAVIFDTRTGCSCESVDVFETENVSTWGELEPPMKWKKVYSYITIENNAYTTE